MPNTPAHLKALLAQRPDLTEASVILQLPAQSYQVFSNHLGLLQTLHNYFGALAFWQQSDHKVEAVQPIEIYAGEQPSKFIEQTPWIDWTREAGKSGRKDAIVDLTFHHQPLRLLHKVKTGMLFIQPAGKVSQPSTDQSLPCMGLGPAEQHPNQIVNFILTQYLNQHLQEHWLLGHAAGLQIDQQGIAIAGLSGGGKSTLMLHLLENGEHFISNDRLLFKHNPTGRLIMRGIPKQPRINPGTIVHNPRLHTLVDESQKAEFFAMPNEQLRELEMKFDAHVDELYWKNCYQPQTNLDYLVVLNWHPTSSEPTQIRATTLQDSPNLIPALMKSPGPFFSDRHGKFLKNGLTPDPKAYQDSLGQVPVFELTGKVDFETATQLVLTAIAR